jgi:hypothetical protein
MMQQIKGLAGRVSNARPCTPDGTFVDGHRVP